MLAAGRVGGDRHRLDEREWVVLHEDAVLERSRLRLVAVADEVVRPDRLFRNGVPLGPGRKRCAAAAEEPGVGNGLANALGAELPRTFQRREAAVGVERRRVDALADAPEQPQRRVARLR